MASNDKAIPTSHPSASVAGRAPRGRIALLALCAGVLVWAARVPSASAQPAPSATASEVTAPVPSGSASAVDDPDARNESYRPVAGGGNTRSGELLLIEAYAVIWLVVFGVLWLSLRRHKQLAARIDKLEADLGRARAAGAGAGEGGGGKVAAAKRTAGSDKSAPAADAGGKTREKPPTKDDPADEAD
ncbi:MAG: CcmD family protein [Polyangiaceae bacterium]|nr:CcmD family protein [Polyangiaceae bacterium]